MSFDVIVGALLNHILDGKLVAYDQSLRLPFLIRGPGVPKRKRVRTTVTNPDLGVTIAAIAKAKPGRDVDGRNIIPFLRRGTVGRVIPLEAYPVHGDRTRTYRGIRYRSWAYVSRRAGEDLYNRADDPGELRDLAGNPKYADVLARMRRWDRLYRDCAGAECRALRR